MNRIMKIAILGATSQIAKDLILNFSKHDELELSLFGREVWPIENWVRRLNIHNVSKIQTYDFFADSGEFGVVMNFIGIGDPAKAQKLGNKIFHITEYYDNLVLSYLEKYNKTKYIFLSSGAVYGGQYQEPVDNNSVARVDINNLKSTDWYSVAKLNAEAKHRSNPKLSIIDIRVFNYFSHTQDMEARFLITDIVRAIKSKKIFETSSDDIVRDFITPSSFYTLIYKVILSGSINTAIDCHTSSPVSKFELLSSLESRFGLRYLVKEKQHGVDATGAKTNYYSKREVPKELEFSSGETSMSGLIKEIEILVNA